TPHQTKNTLTAAAAVRGPASETRNAMTDEAAFLRSILDDPDDEANRLVYADWLEERGDPRAELIRLQLDTDRQAREYPGLDDWHWGTCRPLLFRGGDWGSVRSGWLVVERDLPWALADADDPAYRVDELVAEHGAEWAGPVAPLVTRYGFR